MYNQETKFEAVLVIYLWLLVYFEYAQFEILLNVSREENKCIWTIKTIKFSCFM